MAASTRRPGTGRSSVYIDGLNLYNSALRHSTSRWLDIEKFARTVAAPDQVASVMYVTGRLNPDDASDRESPKRQRHYLKALSARGGVEVVAHNFVVPTESRVVSRGGSWQQRTDPQLPAAIADQLDALDKAAGIERRVMVRLPEEKMTDVALAVAMMDDFHHGRCDRTVLVANDADYRPALEMLADQGHRIHVISPATNVNKKLRDDRWSSAILDLELLESCELPDLFDADGKTFERPPSWS